MNKRNSKGLDPERHNNYKAQAEEIIRLLKTDPKFCQEFFYGTENVECKIAPMRSSILGDLEQNYNVVMSPDDFSTIVYQTLWSEGTWAVLRTYEKRSTFFAWLKKVARNAALDRLREECFISGSRSRTTGNTRLALLSQPVEMRQMIIDEQLKVSKYHDLMCSIYVSRLSKVEIMLKYRMTEQELKQAQKEGESELKDALLRASCWYENEVLRDKTRNNLTVSPEFVTDMEAWLTTKVERSVMADVFGASLSDEEVQEKVLDFLYDFSSKLDWKEQDRNLWRQRFINDTSPVVIAKALGKSRAWVDTRFSRLNKQFETAIKEWWATHAE